MEEWPGKMSGAHKAFYIRLISISCHFLLICHLLEIATTLKWSSVQFCVFSNSHFWQNKYDIYIGYGIFLHCKSLLFLNHFSDICLDNVSVIYLIHIFVCCFAFLNKKIAMLFIIHANILMPPWCSWNPIVNQDDAKGQLDCWKAWGCFVCHLCSSISWGMCGMSLLCVDETIPTQTSLSNANRKA